MHAGWESLQCALLLVGLVGQGIGQLAVNVWLQIDGGFVDGCLFALAILAFQIGQGLRVRRRILLLRHYVLARCHSPLIGRSLALLGHHGVAGPSTHHHEAGAYRS